MKKGNPGEWYQDEYIGGYFDSNGDLIVCEEYGSDEDFDRHSTDVQNGEGYYNTEGKFVRFKGD